MKDKAKTKLLIADEPLRALVEGTASATGKQFCRSLVHNLASALRVRYAFISEFTEVNTRVRILAFWAGEGFLDNFEYDIADTPCEKVLSGEMRHYSHGVQALFPKDKDLVALEAESYLAIPLIDQLGNVLGHLAVIDDKPMPLELHDMSVFKIFGARAGAELERQRAEEALRKAHVELEGRVAERTAELSKANVLLRQEITERQRAEGALRQSEGRYRDLYEEAPNAYLSVDVDGRIRSANRRAVELFGYDPDELIGRMVFDLVADSPTGKPRAQNVFQRFLAGQETRDEEVEFRRADGGQVWGSVSVRPIQDEDGRIVATRSMVVDITQRKRAEEALQESRERYRSLYNMTPVMLQSIDKSYRLIDVSEYWLQVLGYERNEVIGRKVTEFMTGESRHYAEEVTIPEFLKKGIARDISYQFVKKNGELVDILLSAIAERDQEGNFARSLSVLTDVTERKRTEEALRESEARFRQFAEIVPDIIWMTTPDKQTVRYVNPAYERVFGRTRESLYAAPRSWLEAIHPEDRERVMATSLEKEGWGEYLEEFRILRPDGTTRWVRDRAVPIRNERGEVYMHAGIGEDVTERKRAEEALRQAHDELERRVQDRTAALSSTVKLLEEQITERRKAQDELHESREHFRRLVETINVIPWEADLETWRFTYVGPQAVRILDYPLERWFGDDFWVDHIHPEDREYAVNFCLEASSHRDGFEFEYRMVAADGRVVWLRDLVTVVSGETGKKMLRGFMIDITERKRLEKEILEVSAREQRRIGQDLHDGLGQHLTGIAFLSKVLEQKLAAKSLGEAAEAAEIAALVNDAVTQTRDLARGLCPVQLEANGLVAALQELSSKTESLFNVSCRFQCDHPVLIHDNAVATNLYFIAQEGVSNAIKHGRARHIVIGLTVSKDRITLMVKDDGIGFPEVVEEHTGMGLHIMNYRARMIDGTLTFQRDPEGVTTVICSL